MNSPLVVTALHAIFGSHFPTLGRIPYAWPPIGSAGVTVRLVNDSVRGWLRLLRNLRTDIHWCLAGIGTMLVATDFKSIVAVSPGVAVVAPAVSVGQCLFYFSLTLFAAGTLEESGWRGFM